MMRKAFLVIGSLACIGILGCRVEAAFLWESHYDRMGNGEDVVNALAVKGNTVFAAGYTSTTGGGRAFAVRAYSSQDGSVLWEDHYDREGNGADVATALVLKGNILFAGGYTSTATGGRAFSVRAYNVNNGSLLWESHYDHQGSYDDEVKALAVKGNVLIAGGFVKTGGGSAAFAVRAYSTKDGSLLWEDVYDPGTAVDEVNALAVKGNTVFAGGLTKGAFTLRAYSIKKGLLIWEDVYDREGGGLDLLYALAVKGNRVFAGGYTETVSGGEAFTVRAYSAKDGSLLWENHYDREGALSDQVRALTVAAGVVIAGGNTRTSLGGSCWSIRAYSAQNGTLLWEDHYDREQSSALDGIYALTAKGSIVFAGGYTQTAVSGYSFTVRAYSTKKGTLLWGDHYDREGTMNDFVYALTVGGNKVFAGGFTETTVGGRAFSIRAYDF